jgi:putative aldouronate transport system permease protein
MRAASPRHPGRRIGPTMTQAKKSRNTGPLLIIAAPGLVYLLINNYIPMFGIAIAFKNVDFGKGILKSDWSGLKNFEFLFKTSDAYIMIRNTLLYNVAFIALGTICAILIAVLIYEVVASFCSKIFQAGLILPNLVSMVVVSYIVYAFLNTETGFINTSILKPRGINPINWYAEGKYWPFILVIVQIWKTAGYSSIIYIATIAGIDQSMYEAARIDGAGKLRQVFSITLPQLKPTIAIMVLFAVGRIFSSDFGLFYQVPMNSGSLYGATQTIDTYVYRALMQLGDIGMSSAAGVFQSLVGFVLVLGANYLVRRVDSESALF